MFAKWNLMEKPGLFLIVGRKRVVIDLAIYFSRARSTKMEMLNLSKNCKNYKKLKLQY